jgi:hypothetical protein
MLVDIPALVAALGSALNFMLLNYAYASASAFRNGKSWDRDRNCIFVRVVEKHDFASIFEVAVKAILWRCVGRTKSIIFNQGAYMPPRWEPKPWPAHRGGDRPGLRQS